MTVVRKNLLDKIVIEHRTNLVNQLYFLLLKIWDLDQQSKWQKRKTQVFNAYDNQIGQSCIWTSNISWMKQALKNIKWKSIIRRRFLMAGNINTHSSVWNSYCHKRENTTIFEEIIKQFRLFINNKPTRATRPSTKDVSIIDLALLSTQLGPLTL